MQRNVPRCSALAFMTKTHKSKKKKATASTGRKAPNKRKRTMTTARTGKQVATPPVPITIAQEPPTRLPFAFWPLEVMKWWMPRATRS